MTLSSAADFEKALARARKLRELYPQARAAHNAQIAGLASELATITTNFSKAYPEAHAAYLQRISRRMGLSSNTLKGSERSDAGPMLPSEHSDAPAGALSDSQKTVDWNRIHTLLTTAPALAKNMVSPNSGRAEALRRLRNQGFDDAHIAHVIATALEKSGVALPVNPAIARATRKQLYALVTKTYGDWGAFVRVQQQRPKN